MGRVRRTWLSSGCTRSQPTTKSWLFRSESEGSFTLCAALSSDSTLDHVCVLCAMWCVGNTIAPLYGRSLFTAPESPPECEGLNDRRCAAGRFCSGPRVCLWLRERIQLRWRSVKVLYRLGCSNLNNCRQKPSLSHQHADRGKSAEKADRLMRGPRDRSRLYEPQRSVQRARDMSEWAAAEREAAQMKRPSVVWTGNQERSHVASSTTTPRHRPQKWKRNKLQIPPPKYAACEMCYIIQYIYLYKAVLLSCVHLYTRWLLVDW